MESFERERGRDEDSEILCVYRRIRRVCSSARVPREDIDDLSQDVWLWLVRNRLEDRAGEVAWLQTVVRFFILRYWRRRARASKFRLVIREQPEPAPASAFEVIERRIALDSIQNRLAEPGAALLEQVREGNTFVEAADALGIPQGSLSYRRRMLVRQARRWCAADRKPASARPAVPDVSRPPRNLS